MSRYMGQRAALDWIVLNDDTSFLDDDDPSPSVTACFAADIFKIDLDEITPRLRQVRSRLRNKGYAV